AAANPPPMNPSSLWGGNSAQRIQLGGASAVTVVDSGGTQTSRTPSTGNIRTPVALTCGMYGVTPTGWTQQRDIGLNLTEPLPSGNYYPPSPYMGTPMGATQADFYDDPDAPMGTLIDKPLEGQNATNGTGRPIFDHQMTKSGTYANASSVYLQRLANPSLQYNPAPNTDANVAYIPGQPVNPY